MAIDKKQVEHIAKLSKLHFSEEEIETFIDEFSVILQHVGKVNSVNTDGVEPCSNVFSINNRFREDEVKPSMPPEQLLKSTPSTEDTYFLVPNVVE